MAKELTKSSAALPAHLQQHAANDAFDELTHGVQGGLNILSYRGKVWRVRAGGKEQAHVNEEGEPISNVRVVLLKSNPNLAKTYYEEAYDEGDSSPPRCWSADGIKPDSAVQDPVNKTCATCPKNAWGSKVTPQGNKTRACADFRRLAVIFDHELEAVTAGEKTADEAHILMLRVPPASLNPLKQYAEGVLKPKGVPPYGVVTKIGFDPEQSYPKLLFKAVAFVDEDEFNTVLQLRESDTVRQILAESFENVQNDAEEDEDEDEKPVAKKKKKATKRVAVEEEEHHSGDEDEDDEPVRAAKVEADSHDEDEDEDDEDEPPPPPKPAKKKKKKKAAKKPAPPVDDDDDDDDDDDEDDDDFSKKLKSILG